LLEGSGAAWHSKWRIALLLVLFSVSYVYGMVRWGFWEWSADALDMVNALFLPGLLFLVGAAVASFRRIYSTRILLAYALGGLIYGLASLVVAREPWWNFGQIFSSSIQPAWGSLVKINVRSVEQTAYPALLLLPPALFLTFRLDCFGKRALGAALLAVSALGGYVVWSFNGRLGWLSLVFAFVPVFWLLLVRSISNLRRALRYASAFVLSFVGSGIAVFFVYSLRNGYDVRAAGIWGQGLCDERVSLYASFLVDFWRAPWGGRFLRIPYSFCGDNSASGLLAIDGGTVSMVHNVILDIYFSVGWLPVLLLLVAVVPSLSAAVRGLLVIWPAWDWQESLKWSWLCFLVCQWLFQPLQYSDGLLYYFSFFVFGLFASGSAAGGSLMGRLGHASRLFPS
jgi:hypothetical protein